MNLKAGGTVLIARRTSSTAESGDLTPIPQRGRLATIPLVAASILLTLALTQLYDLGLLSVTLSAAVTAVVVLGASILFLGYLPRRLPVSLLGVALAAAPSLVLATALLTVPAHFGLPITVFSTRLAAVCGWWLALTVLRPLVDRIGSPRMPAWRAVLIFAPAFVVLGMCGFAWRGGDGLTTTAQRFAFLFKTEDNATWMSHAYSLLRHGHLPLSVFESEYYAYSSASSIPGVMVDVALRDRPSTHGTAVYAAIDVTMANELLSIAVAGALLAAGLLVALLHFDGEERPPGARHHAALPGHHGGRRIDRRRHAAASRRSPVASLGERLACPDGPLGLRRAQGPQLA